MLVALEKTDCIGELIASSNIHLYRHDNLRHDPCLTGSFALDKLVQLFLALK